VTIHHRFTLGASGAVLAFSTAVGGGAAGDARVVGRVVREDGSPAAAVQVKVVRTSTGVTFFADKDVVDGPTTDAAGGYDGKLPDSYVPGSETDTDWVVTASVPPSRGETEGPSSSFEFEVNTAVQEAPPLPLWETRPVVTLDGWYANVSVPRGPPAETFLTELSIGRTAAGQLTERATTAAFDLRLLEPDSVTAGPGAVAVQATSHADVTVPHREGRTIYHRRIRTARTALTDTSALVPPSRGSPCTVVLTDGRVPEERPCRATDGRFDSVVGDEVTTTSVGVASVTVDLTDPVDAESVVVRRCDAKCVVEVSADGSAWTGAHDVRRADTSYSNVVVASFEPTAPTRFVRVSAPGGSLLASEISVWPAAPSELLPPELPPPGSSGGGSGGSDAVKVVATLLVSLVASALLVVFVRRNALSWPRPGPVATRDRSTSAVRVAAGVMGLYSAAAAIITGWESCSSWRSSGVTTSSRSSCGSSCCPIWSCSWPWPCSCALCSPSSPSACRGGGVAPGSPPESVARR
jgi:hypothetical protein